MRTFRLQDNSVETLNRTVDRLQGQIDKLTGGITSINNTLLIAPGIGGPPTPQTPVASVAQNIQGLWSAGPYAGGYTPSHPWGVDVGWFGWGLGGGGAFTSDELIAYPHFFPRDKVITSVGSFNTGGAFTQIGYGRIGIYGSDSTNTRPGALLAERSAYWDFFGVTLGPDTPTWTSIGLSVKAGTLLWLVLNFDSTCALQFPSLAEQTMMGIQVLGHWGPLTSPGDPYYGYHMAYTFNPSAGLPTTFPAPTTTAELITTSYGHPMAFFLTVE